MLRTEGRGSTPSWEESRLGERVKVEAIGLMGSRHGWSGEPPPVGPLALPSPLPSATHPAQSLRAQW